MFSLSKHLRPSKSAKVGKIDVVKSWINYLEIRDKSSTVFQMI